MRAELRVLRNEVAYLRMAYERALRERDESDALTREILRPGPLGRRAAATSKPSNVWISRRWRVFFED